jgi:hypothetical protein
MSHHNEHRTGDESCPEGLPLLRAKVFACDDLAVREAALLACERVRALRRVQRAEPKLARLGERLTLTALRAAKPSPPRDPAPAVRGGERPDPDGVIPQPTSPLAASRQMPWETGYARRAMRMDVNP